MELWLLIPLLASLQTLLPRVIPSELPPPPPNISVTPEKPQYLIGDTVSIVCTAPGGTEGKLQGFRISGTSGWSVDVRTSRRSFTYTFNITGTHDGGAHTCSYTLLRPSRGPAHSLESQSIVIAIRAPPPAPWLSPTPPGGVTVEGQPLGLVCTAPLSPARQRRFHFSRAGWEVLGVIPGIQQIPGEEEAELRVERSDQSHSGNYSCRYEEWEEEEGKWILSELSEEVAVTVREPAPPPSLWVEPPSGVVGEGQWLRLHCSFSHREFGIRFCFFRDGAEIPVGNVSELLFLQSRLEHSGNFSCRVEEEVGGTWVMSPPSQGLQVTVRARPSQPTLLLVTPPGHAQLLLTCIAPSSPAHNDHVPSGPAHSGPTQRRFYFFHGGVQRLVDTTVGSQSQLSLALATPPSDTEATTPQGAFTCQYEEQLGEGWVLSPPSDPLTLPPPPGRLRLLPLVIGCAVGGVGILLALPLAVWMYRRKRGSSRWRGLSSGGDSRTLPMGDVA
ncbi:titin-like [Myiozetetes cayanensis]|uniref:titin-like n=1 Tax=Myiozetetes cayanensis TaxID=478635 RepID=UPI00215E9435|nr:titin-like [Myiozetetes cayanensis]